MNCVTANADVLPLLPNKGIYYIGQYGTCGYASAARGYLYHYFTLGIPITWEPLYFDNSQMEDDNSYNIVVKSLINKPLPQYDIVIMHSTPDLWPKYRVEKEDILNGKIVIGYCTWETDRLPPDWVTAINSSVNEVWVPSTYNETCFKNSGVIRPIRVVPHIFLNNPLPDRKQIRITDMSNAAPIDLKDKFVFYTIGELNARKGINDLIKVFCETFTASDPVCLFVKAHYKDYSPENVAKAESMLESYLKPYPNPPSVVCFTANMSNKAILALHSIGDCYVSLTKSEGFGLTIFDAFHYGKKIVTTGHGGHLDFLGSNYTGLVRYQLGEVKGMESANYGSEQTWAYPDLDHAKELMKKVYNERTV